MNYISYALEQGKYVNRFMTTEPFCVAQQFTKGILKGKVNEWLKYGFSIHENPCRKEFLNKRLNETPPYLDISDRLAGDTIEVFEEEKPLQLYFPFGNVNVECSRFYYTPTFLRTYSYTYIVSPEAHTATFELCTCGGATLWLNDQLLCDYTPFTRNMRKTTRIQMVLQKGYNKLVVCLDDLAERDTDYYFRLAYEGTLSMTMALPVSDSTDVNAIHQGEEMIRNCCFTKELYLDEDVVLQMTNPTDTPITVDVRYLLSIMSTRLSEREKLFRHVQKVLPPNETTLTLFKGDELIPNYYFFQIGITIDGITIGRKIGTQMMSEEFLKQDPTATLAQRKQKLMALTCDKGIPSVFRCAAEYALGRNNEKTETVIFQELLGVEKRMDCSDFHFVVVLCLVQKYGDRMSAPLRERIRQVALQFRYWIDEPGDDVMWFFSENHALLFHLCQYAASTLYPDAVFETSGRTSAEQKERSLELLDHWFEAFFKELITEWNSSAYIPVDTNGLGMLYTFAEKGSKLHQNAKKALDLIFKSVALNAHKGAVLSTFGRSYEEQLKGNYASGTSSLLYLAYNRGFVNLASMGYMTLCLDDYEAPTASLSDIDLQEQEQLLFQNTQGYEQHVNLYLYKTAHVFLSTAVAFKPFEAGYQEHIVEACIDPVAHVFINHPGEWQPYGNGRPNYWAGNGTSPLAFQHENVSVLIYDLPTDAVVDHTHMYFPTMHFDAVVAKSHMVAGQKGNGYIGAVSLHPLHPVTEGPTAHREYRNDGRQQLWVLVVAEASAYETLAHFVEMLSHIQLSQPTPRSGAVAMPDGCQLTITEDRTFMVNGTPQKEYPMNLEGKKIIREESKN